MNPPGTRPPRQARVEIRVFAGRVELNDREGSGVGPRLARLLIELGVRTNPRFESPCG